MDLPFYREYDLAWTADEDGSERYRIHVKNLETGEQLPDLITGANAAVLWAPEGSRSRSTQGCSSLGISKKSASRRSW